MVNIEKMFYKKMTAPGLNFCRYQAEIIKSICNCLWISNGMTFSAEKNYGSDSFPESDIFHVIDTLLS